MEKEKKQLAFRIETDLHQQFKKLCVDENKTMQQYIIELIKQELKAKNR